MNSVIPGITSATSTKGWISVYADLVKARLVLMVLVTTLAGAYLGCDQFGAEYVIIFHAVLGTALIAGGAAALNQFLEREHDARMRRTAGRPLPSGRLQPLTVMLFGGTCALMGTIYLAALVNPLTCVLGVISFISYLFIYTPLKRLTWWNTAVGTVPGALPCLMGWTATRGQLSTEAWVLFAIIVLWQLPHFCAIAWIYKDDYARAGYKMVSVVEPSGDRAAQQAIGNAAVLLLVSLMPTLVHLAGWLYFAAALGLGGLYLLRSIQFARTLDMRSAKKLFRTSIVYLALLLVALAIDKQ
ncbi:MAG: heme o synthase [Verrucomicrobiae bacterium]|nr:heme o synthase [Verrucomicrobiae bacterium]